MWVEAVRVVGVAKVEVVLVAEVAMGEAAAEATQR